MVTTRLLWVAGLAGLLAGASLASHRRRERARSAPAPQAEPLQRWESEGGTVDAPGSTPVQSMGLGSQPGLP